MEVPIEGGSPAKRELVILKKSDQHTYQITTTTTMAETFHLFPGLPKELRLKIWEQALVDARPGRRILLYKHLACVVPFKHLISPLLLVNNESRMCAKAFYNVKLDIYAVPAVEKNQVEDLDKQQYRDSIPGIDEAVDGKIYGYRDEWTRDELQRRLSERFGDEDGHWDGDAFDDYDYANYNKIRRQNRDYTVDLEKHWSEYVRDRLRVVGASSVRKAERLRQNSGAFYISPEHDVFVSDYSCGTHFCIEEVSKILGADFPSIRGPACHHISEIMSAATCERVSTLVLVRISPSSANLRHCVFAADRTIKFDRQLDPLKNWRSQPDTIWGKERFPCVRAYFVLRWNGHDPWHHFLEDLNNPDSAKLSRHLEQWVRKSSSTDKEGKVAWQLEVKKRDKYIYEFGCWGTGWDHEKADWERDMMAHWDVTE